MNRWTGLNENEGGGKILRKSTSDGVKEYKASMHLQSTSGVDSKILIRLQGLKELRRMK